MCDEGARSVRDAYCKDRTQPAQPLSSLQAFTDPLPIGCSQTSVNGVTTGSTAAAGTRRSGSHARNRCRKAEAISVRTTHARIAASVAPSGTCARTARARNQPAIASPVARRHTALSTRASSAGRSPRSWTGASATSAHDREGARHLAQLVATAANDHNRLPCSNSAAHSVPRLD